LFTDNFSTLSDYRRLSKGNIKYSLMEIIFLTISAMVSGATTYEEIATFGSYKLDWLRQYFPYKKGTPSHDTLGEFYSRINPKEFGKCLVSFTEALRHFNTNVVAIDGKTVKGYLAEDGYPLHILSAFCTANSLMLGQEIVRNGKENEIVAIPRLLDLICLDGATVTIDAMGCQKEIAAKIKSEGADYILQVKGNQKYLKENLEDTFSAIRPASEHTSSCVGHGRVETRKCSIIMDLEYVENAEEWLGLKSLIKIETTIFDKKHKTETESVRYYISSCLTKAEDMSNNIRSHWLIESMHWSLDVVYKEDNQAKRNAIAIENANLLSKLSIALLIDEKSKKKSKPLKRFNAMMDDKYRELLLKL